MPPSCSRLLLATVAFAAGFAAAAPNPPDHRSERVVAALHLSDPGVAARVLRALTAHAEASREWHAAHGAELKQLWARWAKARNRHDPAAVQAALAQIDRVYAGFRPEHDRLLSELRAVLSPAQLATAEDRLIDDRNPTGRVEITYRVYLEEFPDLTPPQKAYIMDRLSAARTAAIDAESSAEKASIFKRRKDEIEAYLGAQGYDVKGMIRAFGQRPQAESGARKQTDGAAGPGGTE